MLRIFVKEEDTNNKWREERKKKKKKEKKKRKKNPVRFMKIVGSMFGLPDVIFET